MSPFARLGKRVLTVLTPFLPAILVDGWSEPAVEATMTDSRRFDQL
jgi:hypothetical protein